MRRETLIEGICPSLNSNLLKPFYTRPISGDLLADQDDKTSSLAFSPANQDRATDAGQRMKRGHREGGAKFPVSWLGQCFGRPHTQTRSSTCTKDWIEVKGHYCGRFQAWQCGGSHCFWLLLPVLVCCPFKQVLQCLPHTVLRFIKCAPAETGEGGKSYNCVQHVTFKYGHPPPKEVNDPENT